MTAYVALFGWSFLAATLLPLASGTAVDRARAPARRPRGAVVTATIGNYLSA
jgi:membrane protein YqaA with SNARE-associated domain